MPRFCSVQNCNNKHNARGFCKLHYARFLRNDAPTLQNIPTIEERFQSSIIKDESSGCWLWQKSIQKTGYGRIWDKNLNKSIDAHRWSYEHFVGPIPEGLELDHLCRIRHCVNPEHLEAVTIKENVLRGISNSAINARKTCCKYGHPYDGNNTMILLRRDGRKKRRCLICNRIASKRSRQIKKFRMSISP